MPFSSKPHESIILILDVQSSLSKGILFLQREGVQPEILFSHSSPIPFREGEKSDFIVRTAMKAVSESVQASLRYLHGVKEIDPEVPQKISAVHYVLSSPWMLSQAKKVTTALVNDKLVHKDMVMKVVADERAKMVEGRKDVAVVEEKIFDIRLNGYPVADWHGKQADELSISFVTSVAGTKMIEKLKQACEHVVRTKDIHFHSSLLLQHIGFAHVYPENGPYTLVRVHGELTDIAGIDGDSCTFLGTYPIGTKTVLRSLAKAAGTDEHAAESMINMRASGASSDASGTAGSAHAAALSRMHDSWLAQLEDSLKTGALSPHQVANIVVSALEREKSFIRSLKERFTGSRVESMPVDDATLYAIALGVVDLGSFS